MRKESSEKKQARRFALVLVVALAVLAAYLSRRERSAPAAVAAAFAGAVALLATLAPEVWLAAFRLWMKVAQALSFVMTRVILTVFFYLVLTPFALVLRLLGKRLLDTAWRDGRASYWIDKPEAEFTVARYEKQY